MGVQVKIKQGQEQITKQVEANTSLLDIISASKMELESYCGGRGVCGKCRAILQPAPPVKEQEEKILTAEEIEEGIRLACLHSVKEDLTVEIEEGGDISILAGEEEVSSQVQNGWHRHYFELEQPSLEDQRSYLTRVLQQYDFENANYRAIKDLEKRREEENLVVLSKGNKVMRMGSADELDRALGIAVDIGTTTVVIYMLDLETGRQLTVESFYNPQKELGADVISRIQSAREKEEGWKKMQQLLLDKINETLKEMVQDLVADMDDIYRAVFAGNTVMLHGFLGVSSEDIANSPFAPMFTEQLNLRPQSVGLDIFQQGEVVVMPAISGYIGGDIVADMLAVDLDGEEDYNLLVDIGTNGEVALGNKEKIYSCSVAAGPSFEGGNIKEGMAALPGAVDSFEIAEDEFSYSTIASEKPRGICGSGLLDLVAGLLQIGVINESGAFADADKMPSFWANKYTRIDDVGQIKLFSQEETNVGRPIFFSQKDVRQLQLAKGAIRAGIEILIQEADIKTESLTNVYLVGGFANYLDKEHACEIGMIPPVLSDRINQAGNGAGAGARMMMLNKNLRKKARELRAKTKYLELSTSMKFQEEFTEQMAFS